MAVACVTNFSVLSAPCHGFSGQPDLPTEEVGDGFLLAALLPELDGPVLDAHGGAGGSVYAPIFLDWRVPARPRYWRSPDTGSAKPVDLLAKWQKPVVPEPQGPTLSPLPEHIPWEPGNVPMGIDPAPAQGNFGALPIERQVGDCVVFGEVASGLDPVAGAVVEILGTGRVVETDAQGRFRIDGLPSGDFTAEASALNYSRQSLGVSPSPTNPTELRFNLTEKAVDSGSEEYVLEEESIVGEYRESSQGDFNLDIKSSPSIASGVGKDDFSRSGISDAGDAVSKISGANIVGGKYAVVRGLGDRYSNTLVNGALISSADPSKKAVQLDLFPSDLLQSISIYKTFVPELPAEFAGGTVVIDTLQFPDKPIIEFEYGQKYNDSLDGDFYGSGTDLGYFGDVDDGLPSAVPTLASRKFTAGYSRPRPPAADNEEAQTAIRQATALHLSSPLRPIARDSHTPESFAVTVGNTFDLGNDLELGVVVAGTSSNGDEAVRDIKVGRSLNSGADGISGTGDDFLNRTQDEDRYTSYAGYGVLGSIGLRSGDRHSFNFTAFKNYRAEDEVTRARKIRDDTSGSGEFQDYAGPGTTPTGDLASTPFGATAATYQALDSIAPLRRSLTLIQGGGHHEIGDIEHPIEMDWGYSRSESLEDRPATRTAFFSQLDFTDPSIKNIEGSVYNPSLGQIFTLSDIYGINPAASQSFREVLATSEESSNSRLDLLFPIWADGDEWFKIKVGGNLFDKQREVRGRLFTYNIGQVLNNRLLEDNGGQFGVDYLDLLNGIVDPNGNPIFNGHANGNRSDGIYIEENTTTGNTVRNVDAGTNLTAAYIQFNWVVGDWDLVGGFRYEQEDRSFEVINGLNPAGTEVPFTSISNEYILPGFTLNRKFGRDDQFNTTIAWSRTVARPTFFEFAPIRTVDQASGDSYQGNPNLTDTLIDNYDVRWAWEPDPTSLLAVSLFHKQLDSPIAQASALGDRTFINGTTGSLQGLEIELQKSFLENWSITSNYTYIDSVLEFVQPPNQTIQTTFDGQPNHIFNLILGWDDKDLGWSAALNYNLTGSYLTAVPLSSAEPPVRREAFSQLDLIVQKTVDFGDSVGIVKLNFANLLDPADTQVFDGTDLIYSSYRRGRSYGLEFEYRF